MKHALQLKTKASHPLTKIDHHKRDHMRLNKYISDAGIASRRKSDELIENGRVSINGKTALIGTKVYPNDKVSIDGKLIIYKPKKVYIALNKPVGIVSTTDKNIRNNLISFMNYTEQIFPIGRLDKESSGLILLTNDGDVVNRILRAEHGHEKEYLVTVDKPFDDAFINQMRQGVIIYNPVSHKHQQTLPAIVNKIDQQTFKIIIKQGLNRQIRRMTQALGYHVTLLQRKRIMHIKLGQLETGYWRYLSQDEWEELNILLNKK